MGPSTTDTISTTSTPSLQHQHFSGSWCCSALHLLSNFSIPLAKLGKMKQSSQTQLRASRHPPSVQHTCCFKSKFRALPSFQSGQQARLRQITQKWELLKIIYTEVWYTLAHQCLSPPPQPCSRSFQDYLVTTMPSPTGISTKILLDCQKQGNTGTTSKGFGCPSSPARCSEASELKHLSVMHILNRNSPKI